jgi:hypothetical protein
MKPATAQIVESELRELGAKLNLTDAQKSQFKESLVKARTNIDDFREKKREEVTAKVGEARAALRERVVNFFTPEQLAIWDTEVSRAKNFLGETASP